MAVGRTKNTMESNPGDLRDPVPTTISIHMDKLIQDGADGALYAYIGITMPGRLLGDVDSMGNVARPFANIFLRSTGTVLTVSIP